MRRLRIQQNEWFFPSLLKELILRDCGIKCLDKFIFPANLEILSLRDNNITSLSSYNECEINWSKLTNLKEVSFSDAINQAEASKLYEMVKRNSQSRIS